ncbi:hypothetical protein QYE76_007725 [Lolium multiflorum]|uniref:Transposase (putative) gypsy type domain-containing protein n=1 Tax=Lolium multiflorum TaxID=4521 RepID=A0AAD8VCW4_LOLMU|nr:hypothetical protein QYE76_007725 [Lolium multiflorum]
MTSTDLGSAEWERSKISNQDINMLKRMGFSKKENALQFPKEESYPKPPINYRVSFVDHLIRGLSPPIHEFLRGLLFVYGLQLHHLTPNSLLHISIFITLCECFLGVQPNWALWKRIFCIRRNSHHNVAYNIGGVVICVRSEVDYFDVKFPDSVQGWRKKWLYIHEESSNPAEENIAPFDGEAKIFRRRSWDAEATEVEKLATEALMTRIHELQNTRGKELSGIEITAYFLRTRVQPLQARKNPFWKYTGEEDADRLSKDLPLKDFEKLIRKISSLNKKDLIPTSCRVAAFSSTNPLPEGHPVLSSLPPLPEGGDVEERAVVDDDNQSTTRPATEIAGSHKSAASAESEATASTHSLPHASKRKRDDVKDSGTSKAEEAEPSHKKAAFNPYTDALVSSDEEEEQAVDATARTRDLAESNKRADALAVKLKQSEENRQKAEKDAATVQGLRERLHKAETALSDNITQQAAREADILSRLESQCRRFVRRTHQEYEVDGPVGDELLDALTLSEIHGDEARDGLENAEAGLLKLFPYFFPKKETPATFVELAKTFNGPEDLGLKLRQEGLKIGVEGTIALTANSQQDVDWSKVGNIGEMETKKWQSLIRAAKPSARPILSFLGVKPAPAPSASKPEVK